jgi:predicted transcriptional regulator
MDISPDTLSRRERQVMEILHARGRATAAEVMTGISDSPGYSAIRALLRVLEEKGHVARAGKSGRAIVYKPAVARSHAQRSATRRLLRTFFGGSIEDAVAALLNSRERAPTDAELKRLAELIKRAGAAAR